MVKTQGKVWLLFSNFPIYLLKKMYYNISLPEPKKYLLLPRLVWIPPDRITPLSWRVILQSWALPSVCCVGTCQSTGPNGFFHPHVNLGTVNIKSMYTLILPIHSFPTCRFY